MLIKKKGGAIMNSTWEGAGKMASVKNDTKGVREDGSQQNET